MAALGLAIISASAPWSGPALAAGDPASARIDAFYAALLDAMKNAKTLGVKGRYDKLAPVVAKTFDVAGMAKGAVGAGWELHSGPAAGGDDRGLPAHDGGDLRQPFRRLYW